MAAKCNGVLQELKGCGDQTAKAWDCLKLREFLTWLSEIFVPEKKKETSKRKKAKKKNWRFSNLSEQDWRCAKQKTAMFLGKTGSKDRSQACEMVLHPIPTSTSYPSQRCSVKLCSFRHGQGHLPSTMEQKTRIKFGNLVSMIWTSLTCFKYRSLLTKLEDPQHHWHVPPKHRPLHYPTSLPNANARKRPSACLADFPRATIPKQKQTGHAECLCNSDSNDASLVSASITLTSESCRARCVYNVNLLSLSPTKYRNYV